MPERGTRPSARELLGGRRFRRVAPAVLAIAAIAVAIGVIVGGGAPASSKGATTGTHGRSGTATVQRRDLVSTDTESGTLGYADTQTVFNRRSGTLTWLPRVGTIIKAGQTLYDVDNSPVILMDGATPAYRTIGPGAGDGPDIAELKRNMKALGYDAGGAITVNDSYDSALKAAIERWQSALGQTQNGTVTLGKIVFLSGPRRIDSISGVLGSTGGGTGNGNSNTAYEVPSTPKAEFVSLTTTSPASTTTPTTTTPTTPAPTTPAKTTPTRTTPSGSRSSGNGASPTAQQLLQELVQELRKPSSSNGSANSNSSSSSSNPSSSTKTPSSSSSAATAIMTTTSANLVVTVNLDATKQSEARVGEPVSVQLPDGRTTTGKITQVSTVAQSSSSNSNGNGGGSNTPSATVPVTIGLTGHEHVQGLDQAAVSVNFQQQVERGVLAVPVTSLIATAGGGYAVQTTENGKQVLIPVSPGLFAGGYVEVSGSQLVEGMQVSDSQG